MAIRSKAVTTKPNDVHDKLLEALGQVDRPGDFRPVVGVTFCLVLGRREVIVPVLSAVVPIR